MSIYSSTSRERAVDLPSDGWPPCCGQPPKVMGWEKKQLVLVSCQNPDCENASGVLEHQDHVRAKWERCRVKEAP